MSKDIFVCLKRERDIRVKTISRKARSTSTFRGRGSFLARKNYLGISTDGHRLNAMKAILNIMLAMSVFPVNGYERNFLVAVTLK